MFIGKFKKKSSSEPVLEKAVISEIPTQGWEKMHTGGKTKEIAALRERERPSEGTRRRSLSRATPLLSCSAT